MRQITHFVVKNKFCVECKRISPRKFIKPLTCRISVGHKNDAIFHTKNEIPSRVSYAFQRCVMLLKNLCCSCPVVLVNVCATRNNSEISRRHAKCRSNSVLKFAKPKRVSWPRVEHIIAPKKSSKIQEIVLNKKFDKN